MSPRYPRKPDARLRLNPVVLRQDPPYESGSLVAGHQAVEKSPDPGTSGPTSVTGTVWAVGASNPTRWPPMIVGVKGAELRAASNRSRTKPAPGSPSRRLERIPRTRSEPRGRGSGRCGPSTNPETEPLGKVRDSREERPPAALRVGGEVSKQRVGKCVTGVARVVAIGAAEIEAPAETVAAQPLAVQVRLPIHARFHQMPSLRPRHVVRNHPPLIRGVHGKR